MSTATIKATAIRFAKSDATQSAAALINSHAYQMRELLGLQERLAAQLQAEQLNEAANTLQSMIHYQSMNCNVRLDLIATAMSDLKVAIKL